MWRHPLLPENLQRAMKRALWQAGLNKRPTSRSLSHSFATHFLEGGTDIRSVRDMARPGIGVKSPLEATATVLPAQK